MANVLKVVFGIGIAISLLVLMLLGIQAFYPEPKYENFCDYSIPPIKSFESCQDNMTVGECRILMLNESSNYYETCSKNYDSAEKEYKKNFFIIANILGILAIIIAYFIKEIINISAGVFISGIIIILWSFMKSWTSANDKLKFVIALIVTAIIIFLAMDVNKRLKK